MAKEGWQRGSRGDEIKLKPAREPVSGRLINSIGDSRPEREVRPSPVGSDTTSKSNRDGST